jgi:hypothetical protein
MYHWLLLGFYGALLRISRGFAFAFVPTNSAARLIAKSMGSLGACKSTGRCYWAMQQQLSQWASPFCFPFDKVQPPKRI